MTFVQTKIPASHRVELGTWWGIFVMFMLLIQVSPRPLYAQVVVPTPTIVADFGDSRAFDMRAIRTLQACRSVIHLVGDSALHYVRNDTLYIDEEKTAPVAVTNIALHCLKQFPIATIDTLELSTALEIAVFTGDTVQVNAVMHRLLALRTTPREQAAVIYTGLEAVKYQMQPVSIPFMQSLVTRLDALGAEAHRERVGGLWSIYDSYRRRGLPPDSMLVLAREVSTAFQRMGPPDPSRRKDADAITLLEDDLRRELAWYTYLCEGTSAAFHAWSDIVRQSKVPGTVSTLIGRPAPAIDGEFWVGRPPGNSTAPTPGGVPFPGSVMIIAGIRAEEKGNAKNWDMFRRIHDRFPAIKIVLLAETSGAIRDRIRVDEPATEAEILGQLYLDSLKLPVWLNVSKTVRDTTLRDAMGRSAIYASKTFEAWGYKRLIDDVYIVNRQGDIVYRFGGERVDLAGLFVLLDRLSQLGQSPVTP